LQRPLRDFAYLSARILVSKAHLARGVATKLAAQQERHDTCVLSIDDEEIAANDDSEQVSTVKRRSVSGDGVDALNTRATDTNLGEVSRGRRSFTTTTPKYRKREKTGFKMLKYLKI